MTPKALEYIDQVLTGARIAGSLEKLAIARHFELFKNPAYHYDEKAAKTAVFIVSLFRHTSGDFYRKPFNLLGWQEFILCSLFGWKRKESGKRLFRKAYIEIAKKNGKSELAGAIGLLGAFFDSEAGAECFSAANKYDQATICWGAGKTMAQLLSNEDPTFAQVCKIYDSITTRQIKNLTNDSFFKPIAADSKTLDGVRPHIAIIDEFHEAKDDSILRNLSSAMVNRSQPLLIIITTAGFNINGPCHRYRHTVETILKGQAKDDSTFGIIFSPDPEDDWESRDSWHKANPSIGHTPTWEGLESEYSKALIEGQSAVVNFKTKNLNQWVRQSKAWMDIRYWNACKGEIDPEQLKGKIAYAGMDLSTKWDITCFGLLFPPQPGLEKFTFLCRHYCPEDGVRFRANRDRVPYPDWAKDGYLIATPGNVIDYDYIRADIEQAFRDYNIPVLYYDPKFATETAVKLTGAGIECFAMRQTQYQFNEPILKIEEWIGKGELNKGKDPILDWMFENVAIRRNQSGLMMFDKDKSREKIDGIVTLGMCAASYLDHLAPDSEKSVYLDRDFLFM